VRDLKEENSIVEIFREVLHSLRETLFKNPLKFREGNSRLSKKEEDVTIQQPKVLGYL
jgi:hypothetical protein